MNYRINEIVKSTKDVSFVNGDSIKEGTKGEIIKIYEMSNSYLVKYEGCKEPHRTPERFLRK